MKNPQYFIYILFCSNNRLYTGYTTDLIRRFKQHVNGTAKCKFTRSFKPIEIAQSWQIQGTIRSALQIERFIKSLTRQQKLNLLAAPHLLSHWVEPVCDDSLTIITTAPTAES
jgi:putative endonuclease